MQKAALFPSGQSTTFVFGFPQDGNDDGGTGCGDVVGTEKCDDSVSKDAARQAAPALECAVCNKMFTSLGDMRRHNLSRRHVQCVCVCVCVRACVGAHASVRLCMQMLVCKRVYSCGAGTNNSSLLKMRGQRQCNCGRRIKAIEAANEGAEIVFAIACETSC